MKKLFMASFCFLIAQIGCSSSRVPGIHYNDEEYERKSDNAPIDVYATSVPNHPYKEIGEYTAKPKKLLIWARRMGADGIIFVDGAEIRTRGTAVQSGNVVVGRTTSKSNGQRGVAIVYVDSSDNKNEKNIEANQNQ